MLAAAGSDQRGERGHLHSILGTGRYIFTKSPDQKSKEGRGRLNKMYKCMRVVTICCNDGIINLVSPEQPATFIVPIFSAISIHLIPLPITSSRSRRSRRCSSRSRLWRRIAPILLRLNLDSSPVKVSFPLSAHSPWLVILCI